ncbi:MAG: hypothetical protein WB543_08170 [Candidatus Acidiferrum sp.]
MDSEPVCFGPENAVQSVVGCLMKSYKAFLFPVLVACLSLGSCSGVPKGAGGGGGGGTANVSFVMVADTPPANLGLISFKVVPTAITLTPTSGTATTFSINSGNGYSFDLVRLQSDSAYLGTVPKIAADTYTTIAVSFLSAQLAFYNGTGTAITGLSQPCAAGAVCYASFSGPFTSTITTSQAISGNAGLGIDVNLAKAISVTGGILSLNFTNSSSTTVVSAFTLPRANSNLANGQLDLIEDFTGIATITGSSVTIAPAPIVNRASITASSASSTNYNLDPTLQLCNGASSLATCFTSTKEAASMDAILKSDGTFIIQEIEPLLASPVVDTVEGTFVAINNTTQFGIVITDIIPAASGSLISSLSIGVPLTVNLAAGPIFYVDSKGLPVASSFPSNYGNFANATTTAALQLGQSVAVHVKAFTAAIGTTAAVANSVDTVTLRWSRFTAPPTGIGSTPSFFSVNTLPGYFNFAPSSVFGVEIFTGTPGANGVTNLDGIMSGSATAAAPAVGIRALYINDATNTFNPAFFAAKVRQH